MKTRSILLALFLLAGCALEAGEHFRYGKIGQWYFVVLCSSSGARHLNFYSEHIWTSGLNRSNGLSVRPVKN